jgi:MurNAc alpha-1-phosphate uridylyltransferase
MVYCPCTGFERYLSGRGKMALMGKFPKSMAGPKRAMVLAAGLGTRMKPFDGQIPKPLVRVGGKALLDYALDRLAEEGVERAVVNVHHLADQIERHLASRVHPQIIISDERRELLGTAGGVIKALPELGDDPFYQVNSDTIWIDGVKPNLGRLASAFDAAGMDALLLVAPTTSSIGYVGRGDFSMAPDGRLARRAEREIVPFVYAGAAILAPAFLAAAPHGPSSMSPFFDRSAQAGRLFGLRLEGLWMHVGTPEAIKAAEAAILASAA